MYRETVLSAARFSNLSSDMLRPLMLQTTVPFFFVLRATLSES